jgi:hypothetical protein
MVHDVLGDSSRGGVGASPGRRNGTDEMSTVEVYAEVHVCFSFFFSLYLYVQGYKEIENFSYGGLRKVYCEPECTKIFSPHGMSK